MESQPVLVSHAVGAVLAVVVATGWAAIPSTTVDLVVSAVCACGYAYSGWRAHRVVSDKLDSAGGRHERPE